MPNNVHYEASKVTSGPWWLQLHLDSLCIVPFPIQRARDSKNNFLLNPTLKTSASHKCNSSALPSQLLLHSSIDSSHQYLLSAHSIPDIA